MTRKLFSVAVLTLTLSLSALAQGNAAPASAANAAAAGSKIGVINIRAAIIATNEGKRDFDALNKKFEPKQGELKAANDEIENLKKQLTAQQDKLSDEERANRGRVIEQKAKSLQVNLENAEQDYVAQQNEIVNRIGSKMINVLEQYSKNNGLMLVVDASNPQSGLLYASESVNIGPAIVDAYNAQSGVAAPPAAPGKATPAAPAAKKPATTPTKPR